MKKALNVFFYLILVFYKGVLASTEVIDVNIKGVDDGIKTSRNTKITKKRL